MKRYCLDCGEDVYSESFIIQHWLWAEAVGPADAGVICVPCLEGRMGRRLESDDFMDVPGNDLIWRKTERLLERMGPDRGLRSVAKNRKEPNR